MKNEENKELPYKFEVGASEYVGALPIRQDITVLPADDPKKMLLDWVCLEGDVVLKDGESFSEEDDFEDIKFGDDKKVRVSKSRLKNFDDLKDGDVVYSTWYDGKVVAMKVEGLNTDRQNALGRLNDYCWGHLHFNDDIRECWRCGGYTYINKYAIAKVEMEKDNA